MLVTKALQLAVLTSVTVLWDGRSDAATSAFKVCGRKLGDIMARVCHVYNSPSWDVPTVVEQPAGLVRRKRQAGGIADECCTYGCTWEQLSEYCSVSVNTDTILEDSHLIEDRSAEADSVGAGGSLSIPAVVASEARSSGQPADGSSSSISSATRREVGSERNGGYGRGRGRRRRRGCWCRRKRRSGRRRPSLMGNMEAVRSVSRVAPVVGTVSPLLTWGRTLNTDLPQVDRDRYAYVAVYST